MESKGLNFYQRINVALLTLLFAAFGLFSYVCYKTFQEEPRESIQNVALIVGVYAAMNPSALKIAK